MQVILFGASGMVGQGVLQVCLRDARVERVLAVTRQPLDVRGEKLEELVHGDFGQWSGVEERFAGYDACFFCLGVSSVGMQETAYRETTYNLTRSVAQMLERMGGVRTFVYVSGAGTDAQGRQMWARVKGETEAMLLAMPFPQVFCFRPGYIQPMGGVRSKTGWYRAIYATVGWLYPLLRRVAAKYVTNSDEVGEAMIAVAEQGFPKRVLENGDIGVAASQG